MSRATLFQGDCLAVMRDLPSANVDAIVTDPPAGIAFMGREWDHDKGGRDRWIAWLAEILAEGLRLLKPGGHALVWSLPRTSHWTGMALEDAGFDVRDRISHFFGSGFPKSLDVSKAMDKDAGAERADLGPSPTHHGGGTNYVYAQDDWTRENFAKKARLTEPASDLAKLWQGWGTALKPGAEDWWLARKPLVGTVAANVAEHGTGGLNIDGCRIATDWAKDRGETWLRSGRDAKPHDRQSQVPDNPEGSTVADRVSPLGRWPANVVLSHTPECREVGTRKVKGITGGTGNHAGQVYGARTNGGAEVKDYADADGLETVTAWECHESCPVRMLDEQSGERGAAAKASGQALCGESRSVARGKFAGVEDTPFYADTGGASRFFYCAKSSRAEREAGLKGMPRKIGTAYSNGAGLSSGTDDPQQTPHRHDPTANHHPTVKPLALMRWLCRLITPPGGTILDPFMGSGTTGCAAEMEGFDFIGIEREAEYMAIARARLAHWAGVAADQPLSLELTA